MTDIDPYNKIPLLDKFERIDTNDSINPDNNEEENFLKADDKDNVKIIGDFSNLKKIALDNDFYSLTWLAIKKNTFQHVTVRGVKVELLPQDYWTLYFQFLLFVLLILVSITLIVEEALIDDVYVEGDFHLSILRMMLVVFTQLNLGHELEIAYAKFIYPISNPKEFFHPSFAIFIGFCHCVVCITTIIGLLVFICMADEFADPVINFAGITVLSELDNWIGDAILYLKIDRDRLDTKEIIDEEDVLKEIQHKKIDEESLNDEEKEIYEKYENRRTKNEDKSKKTFDNDEEEEEYKKVMKEKKSRNTYELENLNERLTLNQKLSLICDDIMEIYVDENINTKAPFYIVWFEKAFSLIPWKIVLPLMTIPISKFLPYLTLKIRFYFNLNEKE